MPPLAGKEPACRCLDRLDEEYRELCWGAPAGSPDTKLTTTLRVVEGDLEGTAVPTALYSSGGGSPRDGVEVHVRANGCDMLRGTGRTFREAMDSARRQMNQMAWWK